MPELSRISVFAPATVANVASGFDVLGFALENPGDAVSLSRVTGKAVTVVSIAGDGGKLPKDPKKNTAAVAVNGYLAKIGFPFGIEIALEKRMPLSSGLGSSAASAVAAVFGANLLAGSPLSTRELLPFTMEAERAACGSAHADNVAPSLLGGFRADQKLRAAGRRTASRSRRALLRGGAPPRRAAHGGCPTHPQEGDTARRCHPPVGQPRGPGRGAVQRRSAAPGQIAAGRRGRACAVTAHPRLCRCESRGHGVRGRWAAPSRGPAPPCSPCAPRRKSPRASGMPWSPRFGQAGLSCDLYISAVNTKGPVVLAEGSVAREAPG